MNPSMQKIRRSQFVLVYGPGSIIEGPHGSRLIPSLKGLGKNNCKDAFFTKYEIKDVRMSYMLNNENKSENIEYHLISIPSNEAVDNDENKVIYSTVMFPLWHVCYKKNPPILYSDDNIYDEHCSAFDEAYCEHCDKENNPNVSFVRACPNGHLDEVNWNYEVHGDTIFEDNTCSNSKFFYWKAKGSLEKITIECPFCGLSTTMKEIYKNKKPCTGRIPENEELNGHEIKFIIPNRPKGCDEEMSVIQKQSTSLRIPYTRTLLKIPHFDESVFNLFNNSKLTGFLDACKEGDLNFSKEQFKKVTFKYFDNEEYWQLEDYLKTHEISDLLNNYDVVERRDSSFTNAIDEEFRSIRSNRKESANFSRTDFISYDLECLNYIFPLEVCAIEKLTTVTAQLSYQRKPHPKKDKTTDEIIESEFITVGYKDDTFNPPKIWYPAFKGVGEGIFITSEENPFNYDDSLENTINSWKNREIIGSTEREEVYNPLFVWWHTLSHAIIKSLSLSSGYSLASLQERVYLDEDSEKGGILIYNTSPGDDSGMGGLVDLVFNENEFKKVLKNAINNLLVCSNDPLCSSMKVESDSVNGSACHNCLLISETSCEHQNTLLDRHFFIN